MISDRWTLVEIVAKVPGERIMLNENTDVKSDFPQS